MRLEYRTTVPKENVRTRDASFMGHPKFHFENWRMRLLVGLL